jgi:hypothetical protein
MTQKWALVQDMRFHLVAVMELTQSIQEFVQAMVSGLQELEVDVRHGIVINAQELEQRGPSPMESVGRAVMERAVVLLEERERFVNEQVTTRINYNVVCRMYKQLGM